MIDRSLWEASGHWEKFGENMFTANTQEDKTLALKTNELSWACANLSTGSKILS